MEIKENTKVITLVDKTFNDDFISKGTIGYVVESKRINDVRYYLLEISDINDDDPLFEYSMNEIKIA